MGGADAVVDVGAVRVRRQSYKFCAERFEDAARYLKGAAVCAVQADLKPL